MSDQIHIPKARIKKENITTNLADIFFRAQISKTIHYFIAERMIQVKKKLGLSNIFLSALSTAGIVTLIGEYQFFINENPALIKFIIFCLSFLSTFIASLILYRDDGFLANTHKIAGDLYIEIRDDIIKLYNQSMAESADNAYIFDQIHRIRHKLDYFGRSAPQTNQRAFKYAILRNPKKEDIIQAINQGDFPFVPFDKQI
ncbi:MAG: SLATT domain-containing protein [Candidatus Magnetomorum sp.]|nr:SLATT domain-containing protein [Candidatus Magnetomorum sp.]